ncbi:MAG: UMP kinase [Euryarchaeota archaeon]|nr:UMP kinase [Euryarchaeota archaeon]
MARKLRVFALGGSILAPQGPDVAYAEAFSRFLLERLALGETALVVTGGGGPARQYIRAARSAGVTEEVLDLLGIDATRLNARFLATVAARAAGPTVDLTLHRDVRSAAEAAERHRVVVMGGTEPGHSTDYVAAALATAAGADHLYVLTNVDGVYTADPRKDPKAVRLPTLDSARLLEIVGQPAWTAGMTGVVDPRCAAHVHAKGLPLSVLDGRDVENVRAHLAGDRGVGSVVTPSAQ